MALDLTFSGFVLFLDPIVDQSTNEGRGARGTLLAPASQILDSFINFCVRLYPLYITVNRLSVPGILKILFMMFGIVIGLIPHNKFLYFKKLS